MKIRKTMEPIVFKTLLEVGNDLKTFEVITRDLGENEVMSLPRISLVKEQLGIDCTELYKQLIANCKISLHEIVELDENNEPVFNLYTREQLIEQGYDVKDTPFCLWTDEEKEEIYKELPQYTLLKENLTDGFKIEDLIIEDIIDILPQIHPNHISIVKDYFMAYVNPKEKTTIKHCLALLDIPMEEKYEILKNESRDNQLLMIRTFNEIGVEFDKDSEIFKHTSTPFILMNIEDKDFTLEYIERNLKLNNWQDLRKEEILFIIHIMDERGLTTLLLDNKYLENLKDAVDHIQDTFTYKIASKFYSK